MATALAFHAYALLLGQDHRLRERRGPDQGAKESKVSEDVAFAVLGFWASYETKFDPTSEEDDDGFTSWQFVMNAAGKSGEESPAIVFLGPDEDSVRATMAQIDEHVEWKDAEPVTGAALFDQCLAKFKKWRIRQEKNARQDQAKSGDEETARRLALKMFPPPPGSAASVAYAAAQLGEAFMVGKNIQTRTLQMEPSSFKSFVIKLKDKRFHLTDYLESPEGSDEASGWSLGGGVLASVYFGDMADLHSQRWRFVFMFVVPAEAASGKRKLVG